MDRLTGFIYLICLIYPFINLKLIILSIITLGKTEVLITLLPKSGLLIFRSLDFDFSEVWIFAVVIACNKLFYINFCRFALSLLDAVRLSRCLCWCPILPKV